MERERTTDPIKSELVQPKRFQPYSLNHARTLEDFNTGPYTASMPFQIPKLLDLPIGLPSGLQSETTADAETNQNSDREDKVLVSNFYHFHIPHASN